MFDRFLTRTRQRWQSISAIGFAGLLFFAGLSQAASKPKPPPPPPADPAIAYWVGTTSTGTWGDMMVMNADGSNQTVVVPGGGTRPVSPSWSPDGQSLVYSHMFNGACSGFHVVSKDQNGNWGAPQPLVNQGQCIGGGSPAWSPVVASDIHTVAFHAGVGVADTEAIFLVQFKLVNGVVSEVQEPTELYRMDGRLEYGPTWSPNGRKLAFMEQIPTTSPLFHDLLVFDLDNLANSPASLIPAGSPLNVSGMQFGRVSWTKESGHDLLVVSAGVSYFEYDVWCVNANAPAQAINLTDRFDQTGVLDDKDPSWSPDDSKIIFSRGGVAMALTIDTTIGCPNSTVVETATLSQVAKAKGKNSLLGFDWRREPQP